MVNIRIDQITLFYATMIKQSEDAHRKYILLIIPAIIFVCIGGLGFVTKYEQFFFIGILGVGFLLFSFGSLNERNHLHRCITGFEDCLHRASGQNITFDFNKKIAAQSFDTFNPAEKRSDTSPSTFDEEQRDIIHSNKLKDNQKETIYSGCRIVENPDQSYEVYDDKGKLENSDAYNSVKAAKAHIDKHNYWKWRTPPKN